MTIEFSINKIDKKDLHQIENIGKECLPTPIPREFWMSENNIKCNIGIF